MIQLFRLKVLPARNFLVLIFAILISALSACGVKKNNDTHDDYILLNMIVKESKLLKPDKTLALDLDNNNKYLSSVIIDLSNYEFGNDMPHADSLKISLGIDDKASSLIIRDSILNVKQYRYLISQKHEGRWDLNHVDTLYLRKTADLFKNYLKVSKPIYTNDKKFALVYVSVPTLSGINVYKKTAKRWIYFKMLGVLFTQPSAREFIDKN